jgi:hypothetical protein
MADKDYVMIISRIEQVVEMRSVLGEDAKDYKDAVSKLMEYRCQQHRLLSAARQIQRHGRARQQTAKIARTVSKTTSKNKDEAAEFEEGLPQPATPSMDQIRATRARQMQYEGGQQYHRSPQQQMAHSETAHVTAMQTQMATLVGHMVSRVGDLEGQVNSISDKLIVMAKEHHSELMKFGQREHEATLRRELLPAEQLAALQLRLEGLHAAELLSDDELFALEDIICDISDLRQTMLPQVISAEMVGALGSTCAPKLPTLLKIMGASDTFRSDAAFARQLHRRWL